jgi:polyphosphate kinase
MKKQTENKGSAFRKRCQQHLIREDQSWLAFNERVLSEAENNNAPLLERLKFLSIFLGNLDEFFMVKVDAVQRESELLTSSAPSSATGHPITALRKRVIAAVDRVQALYESDLIPGLAKTEFRICSPSELNQRLKKRLRKVVCDNVLGLLTPLVIDKSHPFPYFENQRCYVLVQLKARTAASNPYAYGVVQLPPACSRLLSLGENGAGPFVYLEDAVVEHLDLVFPWARVVRSVVIRVTRNRELTLLDDEFDDLLESVEHGLKDRSASHVVRVEASNELPVGLKQLLLRQFDIDRSDIFEFGGRLVTQDISQIIPATAHPLKDPTFRSQRNRLMLTRECPFDALRDSDIWLHHPYDCFTDTLKFLEAAANDPQVVSIKQTLYRTGSKSPVAAALLKAAEAGKQVVAIVELTARFDEQRNVGWAKKLKKAGATVVFGIEGWKTHSKMTLVVRREGRALRRYAHLSTGNYNAKTARLYTDISLMTSNPELTADVSLLFNTLTGLPRDAGTAAYFNTHMAPHLNLLKVAPFGLREFFMEKIQKEIDLAVAGKPARIALKLNSLTDPELITQLCAASCAGVKVELLVRGMCRLQGGIKGLSDNVRVVSVIDRFLEHSRIYSFGQGARTQIFVGSADFMPRNMDRRVECVWPVQDSKGKEKILNILSIGLADNVKAHEMKPDGSYARVPSRGREQVRSQDVFIRRSQKQ